MVALCLKLKIINWKLRLVARKKEDVIKSCSDLEIIVCRKIG